MYRMPHSPVRSPIPATSSQMMDLEGEVDFSRPQSVSQGAKAQNPVCLLSQPKPFPPF